MNAACTRPEPFIARHDRRPPRPARATSRCCCPPRAGGRRPLHQLHRHLHQVGGHARAGDGRHTDVRRGHRADPAVRPRSPHLDRASARASSGGCVRPLVRDQPRHADLGPPADLRSQRNTARQHGSDLGGPRRAVHLQGAPGARVLDRPGAGPGRCGGRHQSSTRSPGCVWAPAMPWRLPARSSTPATCWTAKPGRRDLHSFSFSWLVAGTAAVHALRGEPSPGLASVRLPPQVLCIRDRDGHRLAGRRLAAHRLCAGAPPGLHHGWSVFWRSLWSQVCWPYRFWARR